MANNIIKQTSRTILFEEFNRSENPGLDILISNPEESPEVKHENVKTKLEVTSFADFMNKFTPKYYDCIGTAVDEDGNEFNYYSYTLDKSQRSSTNEYKLENQPFYNAIMELYEKKGTSSTNDFSFDFNEILQRIYNPKTARDKINNIYDKFKYNVSKYQEIETQGGNKAQMQIYAKEIIGLRRHLRDEYLSKTQFNMLPLFINEISQLLEDKPTALNGITNKAIVKNIPGKFFIGEDGAPELENVQLPDNNIQPVVQLETHSNDTALIGTSAPVSVENRIANILSKDFDDAKEENKNLLVMPDNPGSTELMKKMYLSLFAGAENAFKGCDRKKLEEYLDEYKLMYKAAHENFANQVVALVEKVIGVKAFFEHAGGSANLIVANSNLEKLMDNTNRYNFETFMKREGQERNGEKIWLAIIPAVFHEKFCKSATTINEADKDLDIGDRLSDNIEEVQIKPLELLSFSTFKSALKLLCENNIITFFNFKACKDTNSAALKKETVQDYKHMLEPISQETYSAYAAFCYPNFTILPEGRNNVSSQNNKDKSKYDNDSITLPPAYLDASYIACGLTVLSQNTEKLEQHEFPVKRNHCQPVRFDFEGKFKNALKNIKVPLAHAFPTKLNRESILSWDKELIDEITKDGGFGFCFCGDEKWYDAGSGLKRQDHAYIFRARTLYKKDGRYRPIYKTYVKVYIDILTQQLNSDKQELNKYLQDYHKGIESKAYINNLLYSPECSSTKEDERIEIEEPKDGICKVNIYYGKDIDDFKFKINDDEVLD